jgi:hypothetical protein
MLRSGYTSTDVVVLHLISFQPNSERVWFGKVRADEASRSVYVLAVAAKDLIV